MYNVYSFDKHLSYLHTWFPMFSYVSIFLPSLVFYPYYGIKTSWLGPFKLLQIQLPWDVFSTHNSPWILKSKWFKWFASTLTPSIANSKPLVPYYQAMSQGSLNFNLEVQNLVNKQKIEVWWTSSNLIAIDQVHSSSS